MNKSNANPFTYTSEIAISPFEWGKDHWSTLLYAESRCVDGDGSIRNANMRTDHSRHPLFIDLRMGVADARGRYPTRGLVQEFVDHDDWDCLWDLAVKGFIEFPLMTREEAAYYFEVPRGRRGRIQTYEGEFRDRPVAVVVRMTTEGNDLAARVRAHKASGGNYGDFRQ